MMQDAATIAGVSWNLRFESWNLRLENSCIGMVFVVGEEMNSATTTSSRR